MRPDNYDVVVAPGVGTTTYTIRAFNGVNLINTFVYVVASYVPASAANMLDLIPLPICNGAVA